MDATGVDVQEAGYQREITVDALVDLFQEGRLLATGPVLGWSAPARPAGGSYGDKEVAGIPLPFFHHAHRNAVPDGFASFARKGVLLGLLIAGVKGTREVFGPPPDILRGEGISNGCADSITLPFTPNEPSKELVAGDHSPLDICERNGIR